ncbi:MAG: hypothetical protein ACKO63_20515 [Nodosilinea sp.]
MAVLSRYSFANALGITIAIAAACDTIFAGHTQGLNIALAPPPWARVKR